MLSVWTRLMKSPPAGAVSTDDDWNASVIGCLDAGHDAGRIDGAQDDAVVLLGDGVLHLTDLIGDAAGGRQGKVSTVTPSSAARASTASFIVTQNGLSGKTCM